jgi:GPI-anchor transamidase subunit GAA1
LPVIFLTITALTLALPVYLAYNLARLPLQTTLILQSFSLLLLGATLSTLATLNFSLALLLGLITSPLAFIRPLPSLVRRSGATGARSLDEAQTFARSLAITLPSSVLFAAVSPPVVLLIVDAVYTKLGIEGMLTEMARGWVAQGAYTALFVWGLWWPSWIIGGAVLWSGCFRVES